MESILFGLFVSAVLTDQCQSVLTDATAVEQVKGEERSTQVLIFGMKNMSNSLAIMIKSVFTDARANGEDRSTQVPYCTFKVPSNPYETAEVVFEVSNFWNGKSAINAFDESYPSVRT